MEVGRQVLSRPPASAPLWGRPRLERRSGYGAAEASSASPSRAESTPGLQAGRCRRCGAAWRCHGNGLGLAGRSRAGGLLEGVPQVQRTTRAEAEPSVRARETWCGCGGGVGRWWPPEGWEERPRGGIGAIGFSSKNLTWGGHLIPGSHNCRTPSNRFRSLKDASPKAPSKLELPVGAAPAAAAAHRP